MKLSRFCDEQADTSWESVRIITMRSEKGRRKSEVLKPLFQSIIKSLRHKLSALLGRGHKETRALVGLIGIAFKYAFDALEKGSILLCKNGLLTSQFPINFLYHVSLRRLNLQTNKLIEKPDRDKHGFCMLSILKEANIHFNLICFDVIWIIHTSMSLENSPKSQNTFHRNIVFR